MTDLTWTLRPAQPGDREFLFELQRATMKPYIEQVRGWSDARQPPFFDARFEPGKWQIIQVGGRDVGLLIVEEGDSDIYLADIQVIPAEQGRGIGSTIIRSLMERASSSGKTLSLRVLKVNSRAHALYERIGFRPFREIETHTYLRWPGIEAGSEP